MSEDYKNWLHKKVAEKEGEYLTLLREKIAGLRSKEKYVNHPQYGRLPREAIKGKINPQTGKLIEEEGE